MLPVIVYLITLVTLPGCEDTSLLETESYEPAGLWIGQCKDSDSSIVVVTYEMSESNTYLMNRKLSDEVRYHEEGEWSLSNNVVTFTPNLSVTWNESVQELETVTTEEMYTQVIYENSLDYYYWDNNSEFIIINMYKM